MPLNKLSEQLRMEIAQSGFTEVLTFALVIKYGTSSVYHLLFLVLT